MAVVQNQDLVGLLVRLARFKEEALKSVSSSSSELNQFDTTRLKAYLAAMTSYLNWVVAEPQLDLPESAPKDYTVPDAPPSQEVESEIIADVGRLLDVCYKEALDSQSARKAAGIIGFDESRVRAVIAKIGSYLDNYVANQTPLDLPESSPAVTSTGPGRTGTNP